jgi:hypothetical protein
MNNMLDWFIGFACAAALVSLLIYAIQFAVGLWGV